MKIKDLTVSYEGKTVINKLTLEIENGITCVMGESGQGKTTLLNAIAGLIPYESGTMEDKPERISYMFQEDRLFPWLTAFENVNIVAEDPDEAERLLKLVELSGDKNKMPSELSGGMRRRVALARTLACKADLIILDEPFKGLDEALKERMAELIKKNDAMVIVTTHDERDVTLLDAKKIVLR